MFLCAGWNKLHFASAQTSVYTKMFAVHDIVHTKIVYSCCHHALEQICRQKPFARCCIQNTDNQPTMSYVGYRYI